MKGIKFERGVIESMEEKSIKSQKGAISVFVTIAMIFFLVTTLGIYMISSKRAQTQTQSVERMQTQYYTEEEEIQKYNAKIESSDEIIPIYTKEQYWSIGENKWIEIDGKIYDFSRNRFKSI